MKDFEHTSKKLLRSTGRTLVGKDIVVLEDLFDKALKICGIHHDRFINLGNNEIAVLQDEVSEYITRKLGASGDYHHKSEDRGRLYKTYQKRIRTTLYGEDLKNSENSNLQYQYSIEDRISNADNLELPWDTIVGNSLAFYATSGEKKNWATYRSKIISENSFDTKNEDTDFSDDTKLNGALNEWKELILRDSYFDPVKMIFSFDFQSNELYQKLEVVPLSLSDKLLLTANPMASEFELSSRKPNMSILTYPIDHLLHLGSASYAIIGIPGIGKTSSLKWILRQIAFRKISVYKHAFYISLRDLDVYFKENPDSSLYAFIFAAYLSKNLEDANSIGRDLEEKTRVDAYHSVFLLDGLDEVPSSNRISLIQRLAKDLLGRTYILSTRPTAAHLLNFDPSIKLYEIIPLKKRAVKELIRKYCKHNPFKISPDELLVRISHDLTINKFVTSTFVLMIFCEIIASKEKLSDTINTSLGALFKVLVKIIQTEHNSRHNEKINEEHLKILTAFAEELTDSSGKKILSGHLMCDDASRTTLSQSRYINEIMLYPGFFEFTHLRIQEYFTAEAILDKGLPAVNKYLDSKIFNFDWLEITCMIAGLTIDTKIDKEFNHLIGRYFPSVGLELTKNSLLILIKILVAKKVSLKTQFGNITPYTEGLKAIKEGHALAREFVSVMLESNPLELLKDLRKETFVNAEEIWIHVYSTTPFYIKEQAGLNAAAPIENSALLYLSDPGFVLEKDLVHYRSIVANWKLEDPDNVENALSYLSRIQDSDSIDLLREIIADGPKLLQFWAVCCLTSIESPESFSQVVKTIIEYHEDPQRLEFIGQALTYRTISDTIARERLFQWIIESENLSSDTISSLVKILKNTPVSPAISRKITKRYIEDSSIFKDEAIYDLFSNLYDGQSLDLLIDYALNGDFTEAAILIKSIPYIPKDSFSKLDRIFNKMNKDTNREEKLSYISLLTKSYKKYPDHFLIGTVPDLIIKEINNTVDTAYVCSVLQNSKECNHIDGLASIAWNFILDKDAQIGLREESIKFLNGSQIRIDFDLLKEILMVLAQDQKDKSKFKFIKTALLFIVTNSRNNVRTIVLVINKFFDEDNKREFLKTLIHFAQLQRELVFIDKL